MLLELMIAEEREEARKEGWLEGFEEGRREGLEEARRENRKKGGSLFIIKVCCRKLAKGKPVTEIADALGSDISEINAIVDVAQNFAPDYDAEKIYQELQERGIEIK